MRGYGDGLEGVASGPAGTTRSHRHVRAVRPGDFGDRAAADYDRVNVDYALSGGGYGC
jgi:hypothetical protein